jgi:hypothetical protein
MRSSKVRQLVHRVYDTIETGLWSILITSVVFIAVFVVPKIPAIKAQYEIIHAREIADENAFYCTELNMKMGTQPFAECLLLLGDFRVKTETRIYRDNIF